MGEACGTLAPGTPLGRRDGAAAFGAFMAQCGGLGGQINAFDTTCCTCHVADPPPATRHTTRPPLLFSTTSNAGPRLLPDGTGAYLQAMAAGGAASPAGRAHQLGFAISQGACRHSAAAVLTVCCC